MALELEILLQSFGDDEPSGPDFEYEQEFADLMIAAQSKAEQQVGDQVIEAEPADYSEVMKLAPDLLAKTKDLRIAVVLAEATLNRRGFSEFAVVVTYIRRVLEEYWDSVHPQLDADDDNDPTERLNAVLGLTGEEGVLQQLRRASLTDGKMLGKYTLRHIAVTKGEMVVPGDMDETPDDATITAAFQETPPEIMAEIHAGVTSALQDAQGIEAFLDEKTPGNSPDFKPLLDLLKQADAAIRTSIGEPVSEVGDAEQASEEGVTPSGGGAGGTVSGVNSAADVKRTIDLILDYYKRAEPSSPVPLILMRARRLVGADFMTIVQDLAASAEDEVRTIGGNPAEDQY